MIPLTCPADPSSFRNPINNFSCWKENWKLNGGKGRLLTSNTTSIISKFAGLDGHPHNPLWQLINLIAQFKHIKMILRNEIDTFRPIPRSRTSSSKCLRRGLHANLSSWGWISTSTWPNPIALSSSDDDPEIGKKELVQDQKPKIERSRWKREKQVSGRKPTGDRRLDFWVASKDGEFASQIPSKVYGQHSSR